LHGDSDRHGQGLSQSDLPIQVQGDSRGDSQFEKEGDPKRDCRRDLPSDSGRDLQRDFGGDFQGDLRSDFHDPFAGRSEEGGGRREERARKCKAGLTLGEASSLRLFSCAVGIGVYNTFDFQRGLSIVQS
jgi:hypothetical protein